MRYAIQMSRTKDEVRLLFKDVNGIPSYVANLTPEDAHKLAADLNHEATSVRLRARRRKREGMHTGKAGVR